MQSALSNTTYGVSSVTVAGVLEDNVNVRLYTVGVEATFSIVLCFP